MEHFNPKEVCRSYDLAALMSNIKEVEDTGEISEVREETQTTANPLIGKDQPSKRVFPIEIRLEDLEEKGEEELDWEDDLLKIVESCEPDGTDEHIPETKQMAIDESVLKNSKKGFRGLMRPIKDQRATEPICPILLGVNEINKIVGILSFFNLNHDVDYSLEGDEDGMIRITRPVEVRDQPKMVERASTSNEPENKLFTKIMEIINRGIRIKKKYGKGFVKIDAENLPVTHHEIYNIVSRLDKDINEIEGFKLVLKKAKGTRSMIKSMDLDNIIIL
ncbi:MAG: polymerase-associated protein [Huanggang Rhabd tick virus 2]|uniref:Polymerase-associated protein n=1 Tax=Huanggang Rhabd tick virus 2 TaxID=2972329 RepID=A0A9E7V2B2_9RHAB|nr:MAG: polymerase-associated protein [Huanggang Rhabd tick virus 2]